MHLFNLFSSGVLGTKFSVINNLTHAMPALLITYIMPCRHEKYLTQYRAMFVVNCKIKDEPVSQGGSKRKRRSRKQRRPATETVPDDVVNDEAIRAVCCAVCWTEVGIVDDEEVYHFFHVLPSES